MAKKRIGHFSYKGHPAFVFVSRAQGTMVTMLGGMGEHNRQGELTWQKLGKWLFPESDQRKTNNPARKPYTAGDIKLLKQHSKARMPVPKIAKLMKRSEGSLRQKARAMGIGLGHQR